MTNPPAISAEPVYITDAGWVCIQAFIARRRRIRLTVFAFMLVFVGLQIGFLAGWLAAGGAWGGGW